MEWLGGILDFILHIDRHLGELIRAYGTGIYAIIFAIVFCETGLVITPFLPGDSLLFACGVLSRQPGTPLDVWLLSVVILFAALLGDNVNYLIGRTFGEKLFRNEKSKLFKRSHLDKTHAFFDQHGGKTIVIARFVPIVRTFAPFVAGMGKMPYRKFISFSVAAALLWVVICVGAGYAFGSIPVVRDNFSIAVLGMIVVSLLPAIIEVVRHKRNKTMHAIEDAIVEAGEPDESV